jgi:hypothetical protein
VNSCYSNSIFFLGSPSAQIISIRVSSFNFFPPSPWPADEEEIPALLTSALAGPVLIFERRRADNAPYSLATQRVCHFRPESRPREETFFLFPFLTARHPSKVMSFLIESDLVELRGMCRYSPTGTHTHTHTHFNITHPALQRGQHNNQPKEKEKKKEKEEDDKMGDEMSFDSGMLKRFRDCVHETGKSFKHFLLRGWKKKKKVRKDFSTP